MLTGDQVGIVLLTWLVGACMVALWVLTAGRHHGRHVAGPNVADAAQLPTAPLLLGALWGAPSSIPRPRPRPYTDPDGIGLGALLHRPACRLCRDGQQIFASTGACPWCGHQAVMS